VSQTVVKEKEGGKRDALKKKRKGRILFCSGKKKEKGKQFAGTTL